MDEFGGVALSTTVGREVKIAASIREDETLHLYAEFYKEFLRVSLSTPPTPTLPTQWFHYIIAVLDQIRRKGIRTPGLNLCICGDIPFKTGLSSSAALEVCVATLAQAITQSNMTPLDLAVLTQNAEYSEWIGVKRSFMAPLVSTVGRANHILKVDCHSLEYQAIKLDVSSATLLIINPLCDPEPFVAEMEKRKREAEEGLTALRILSTNPFPTVRHLPPDLFELHKKDLPENVRKRLRHILSEHDRVLACVEALEASNFEKVGLLLDNSHASLRDNFEVSRPELNRVSEITRACQGVYGCCLTGTRSGQCLLALTHPDHVADVTETVFEDYLSEYGVAPEFYISAPIEGARVWKTEP